MDQLRGCERRRHADQTRHAKAYAQAAGRGAVWERRTREGDDGEGKASVP